MEIGEDSDYPIDPVLVVAIRDSLAESTEKTYHYVLVTQLVAKVTNPQLSARSIQGGAGIPGSFNARTLCTKAIVPFERIQLDGALGRSPDPYVSNPLRVPLLIGQGRSSKGDREMWDKLCEVIDAVENGSAELTKDVFRQVLLEIYRKLGTTDIKYDVPLRASLANAVAVMEDFIREQSGGDRPLALTAALFQVIGDSFRLFKNVRREKINTSDRASGQVADIECQDNDGRVVIAVEVKDRTITVSDFEEKLTSTRQEGIREVFFVSARGNRQPDGMPDRLEKEFAAGQNLYVFNLIDLARSILALAGEHSRRDFLIHVGEQLDSFSDTKHRLAWKKALQQMSLPTA